MTKQKRFSWSLRIVQSLPARNAPRQVTPGLYGDLNAIDDTMLEISRASSIPTGAILFFMCVMGGVGLPFLFPILIETYQLSSIRNGAIIFPLFLIVLTIIVVAMLARLEFTTPRDRPVRFNRKTQKIYVYEHAWSLNPWRPSRPTIRIFDWNTISAEITQQSEFSEDSSYRWSLDLVNYMSGTAEAGDRFSLTSHSAAKLTPEKLQQFHRIWEYCRQYMEKGRSDLPKYRRRNQEVTFRHCFFRDIEFLDPGPAGHEALKSLSTSQWMFRMAGLLFGFWIILPSNICYYIVSRFAVPVKWPPAIDVESRGLLMPGSGRGKPDGEMR